MATATSSSLPVEKCGIRVDDAPFTPIRMQVDGEGRSQRIAFETNCDDLVTVDAEHPLRFATEVGTGGLKPYVLVRANLEALVIRALFYDLVARGTVEGWVVRRLVRRHVLPHAAR
jgi:hypothetical protein